MSDRSVFILGGGAWGLSTALHLDRLGYTDITVFERAEQIPSEYSAAFDVNKIVRAEYEDAFYTKLALPSKLGSHLFSDHTIIKLDTSLPQLEGLQKRQSIISKKLWRRLQITQFSLLRFVPLKTREAFKDYAWQFSGPLNGFKGYFNRLAGYAHSSNTLHGIWLHCVARGIKFILGDSAGKVVELLYENGSGTNSSEKKCLGIKTADGKTHLADTTICALGANGASLIPDLGRFVVARCWSVAHVQLTKTEADLLRGLPTTNIRDLGFFFEPDPETHLFKLCPLGAGYTNTASNGLSLPPGGRLPAPQNFIPAEDERKLRQLLREVFPWMAERPFVDQRLCWFADTIDSEYCIDFVPGTKNSLVVLSGDSGHGFKMMPIFGKWVGELLEKGRQELPRWQWRTTDTREQDWGKAVSWRIGEPMELSDLIKAKQRIEQARL